MDFAKQDAKHILAHLANGTLIFRKDYNIDCDLDVADCEYCYFDSDEFLSSINCKRDNSCHLDTHFVGTQRYKNFILAHYPEMLV